MYFCISKKKNLKPKNLLLYLVIVILVFIFLAVIEPEPALAEKQILIGILMANDTRKDCVNGFKQGIEAFHEHKGQFIYTIRDANNDKKKLPALARSIISEKPDIAIAAGGIEADALKEAVQGTSIPIVFLSVASSISRGLSSNMTAPDKNITGIDTNDTNLTAKRLWFIKRILPDTKTVFCYHIPSNVPSVESIQVAIKKAPDLGLELIVKEVETTDDIIKATEQLSRQKVDVILLNPVARIHGALKTIIFPKAMKEKIPIFGYGIACVKGGAFASYAGSRESNGRQAARLAHKIIHGILPKDIPIEIPEQYEFVINQWMVKALGIRPQNRIWKMADIILETPF